MRERQTAYSPEANPAERVVEEVLRWTDVEVYASIEAKQEAADVYLHILDRNPDLVRQLCGCDSIAES